MATVATSLSRRGFGETARRDTWWLQPLGVFLGFSAFIVYTTWAGLQGEHYTYGPYLSPFYSPELFGDSPHAWFGPKPGWWPSALRYSPAFLILVFPAGFRLTCYYYRGAYYKAFWADPPQCTVGEPRSSYWGERSFPLILQNIHRYFLYAALIFNIILSYDVWEALWFKNAAGGESFGIGLGTVIMAVNVALISRLRLRLPFAAPPRRRPHRPAVARAARGEVLQLRQRLQPPPHAVGVDESLLGRIHGFLHPHVLDGRVERSEALLMAEYQAHDHDVLVIGAGGAGLSAAIAAAAQRVSVGLVCKSLLGKAHTVMAEGGVAASLANVDDRDNWKVHFADTMRGGQYLNNWRMAELHAKEAPDRVRELEAWGALFDRTSDGRILQRNFGGHKYPRLAHVGDRTGLEMIRTLQDHGIHQGIDVHMECTVLKLLIDDGRVVGAFGYDRERGRFRLFRAKAVVLATGGIGRAYKITSNSWEYTGDGQALAYQAGADLMDMEFVQFHPTGMVWPPSVRGLLVTEGVRGEGGVLRNKDGKRFMFEDIPDLYKNQTADNEEEGWRYTQGDKNARRPPELLTRDHVARCIVREVREGRGSPHGGVFLDISWIKARLPNAEEHIKKKLPSMYHQFKELAGIDITKEPMEIGPTTHYIMGGIRVDADSQMSTLPGLFAAGECAAGLHGANRLGGNSLSDLLVFGKRAGDYAAKFASENRPGRIDEASVNAAAKDALTPFERAGGEGPYQVQYDLQNMMQELVGIVRNEADMRRALEGIFALRERASRVGVEGNREYNPGWHTALDLANLLSCSEAVTRSALERKESRGGHFREDFANKDAAYAGFNVVCRKGSEGEMQMVRQPLAETRADLKQIIEENK